MSDIKYTESADPNLKGYFFQEDTTTEHIGLDMNDIVEYHKNEEVEIEFVDGTKIELDNKGNVN